MKTEDILNLDYRKEENKEIIQKVLRKIKPLSKYPEGEQIPIEAIEKVIRIMCKKYEISPQWLSMTFMESDYTNYMVGVKTTTDHKWLGNAFGMCLYEVFAKLAIKIYSEIKSGKIELRSLSKEEKQRQRIINKMDKEE